MMKYLVADKLPFDSILQSVNLRHYQCDRLLLEVVGQWVCIICKEGFAFKSLK
jgi:hypothetical protein